MVALQIPMPRLMRFSSSEIAMFFADHNPPHFHVLGRDGAAMVRIDTLEVIASSGRIDLAERWHGRRGTALCSKRSGRNIAETANEHRQDRKRHHPR